MKIEIRIEKDTGCALLKTGLTEPDGKLEIYSHIGQHSTASKDYWALRCSKPKTIEEQIKAIDLLVEYAGQCKIAAKWIESI